MFPLDTPLPLYAILFPVSGAFIICLVVQSPRTKLDSWCFVPILVNWMNCVLCCVLSRIGRHGASLPVSSFHGRKNFLVFVSHFLLNSAVKCHLAPGSPHASIKFRADPFFRSSIPSPTPWQLSCRDSLSSNVLHADLQPTLETYACLVFYRLLTTVNRCRERKGGKSEGWWDNRGQGVSPG